MVLTPVREYFFLHVSSPQIASQRYQFKDFGLINLKTKYNPYHLQFILIRTKTYSRIMLIVKCKLTLAIAKLPLAFGRKNVNP